MDNHKFGQYEAVDGRIYFLTGAAHDGSDMTTWSRPSLAILAWGLWALTLAFGFISLALALLYNLDPITLGSLIIGEGAAAGLGALVVTRRPAVRSGWLLISIGFTTAVGSTAWVMVWNETQGATSYPLHLKLFLVASEVVWSLAISSLLLLLLTAPDGRFLSRRWRLCVPVVLAFISFWSAWAALNAFTNEDLSAYLGNQGTLESGDIAESPLMELMGIGTVLTLVALAGLSALALVTRYRHSRGEERQQVKWVVFGCGLALLFQVGDAWHVATEPWSSIQAGFGMASYLSVTLGFGFALLRYRLWDIDLVIRRSLVYGTVWLGIAGAYFGAALALGLAASSEVPVWLAVALTALATLVFQPARRWLEQAADHWVFGHREEPLKVVHGFGATLGTADHADDIAALLAHAVAAAAPLGWLKVTVPGSREVEVGVRRDGPAEDLPLSYGGEGLGRVSYQELPGSRLSDQERATLQALTAQAAVAISRAQLASRIVRAQEAERRRLERNIHDGAQQELVALVARLGLARSQNGTLDHARFLTELQDEVRTILANLRELAQGVHPSVLTDGGLAVAVEDRCSRLTIPVVLEIDDEVRKRRLPDDIEAAAYYAVAEGLTNLLRHSKASSAFVALRVRNGRLSIEVADNGTGFEPRGTRNGGGLQGLADRFRALGGELEVESAPGKGTRLTCSLPVTTAAPA